MRSPWGSRHFYGLPHDGFETRTGAVCSQNTRLFRSIDAPVLQWVDAIADAGGKLYCFHIEATCKPIHRTTIHRRYSNNCMASGCDYPYQDHPWKGHESWCGDLT